MLAVLLQRLVELLLMGQNFDELLLMGQSLAIRLLAELLLQTLSYSSCF